MSLVFFLLDCKCPFYVHYPTRSPLRTLALHTSSQIKGDFPQSVHFRLAVCDTDQKEITIDETYCWSVDHLGRPIDIYSEADYRMQVSIRICYKFQKIGNQ